MVGPLAAREENISAWNCTSSKNPLCPLMGAGGRRRSLLHSCFQCSPFSSLVLEIGLSLYISREKGDPNTAQGSCFPLQSYS